MSLDDNVIYHTLQRETSHFRSSRVAVTYLRMSESEVFRHNLKKYRMAANISAAELSRAAKLNDRAVKDIEEGRAQSPKLATVFALSKALGIDPGEMIGLGPRPKINQNLADFLSQYDEDDQERLLGALAAIAPQRD